MSYSLRLFVLFALFLPVSSAAGQPEDDAPLDARLLYDIYEVDSPLARGMLRAADLSAYPAFGLVVPAVAVVAWQREASYAPAYRVMVAEGVAFVGVGLLKRLYARDRPYTERDDVASRANALDEWVLEHDPLGFPSGHAALSFAVATSLALSYSQWEVAVPAITWALLVSTSRVWLGVHYPSDVAAGAILGVASAYSVHLLQDEITPGIIANGRLTIAGGPGMLMLRVAL